MNITSRDSLPASRKIPKVSNENLPFVHSYWRYAHQQAPAFFFTVKTTLLTLFLIYIGIPIFVKSNPWIMPRVVFANLLRWPPFINLSSPADFGLLNTRHFYLNVEDNVTVGTWHVLPKSLQDEIEHISWDEYEDQLRNGKKVFLYLHGNSGTRGSHHRVQLYKLLADLDFHVVTLDYRGYGDSTGVPTEEGVVKDAYFVYKWLKQRVGGSNIFLWGHSLGTGVTTKLAKILCDEGDEPAGVVLEAPFNNMQDAATYHPFAFPYRRLPWFEWIFLQSLGDQGIYFKSDESISSVTPHILILHAKDDLVVPFHLGKKLYHKAKATRTEKTKTVEFVPFEANLGYGHKLIYQAPEMADIIRQFIVKSESSD
ncbi:monoacylglycerol lipase abhd12 [Plakobranchus ocellatus]|uniref:Monoacylglycerol lipase abhd12 n=1 Tax=Plakobranchus ocellatus TaxID=259542 RepID=A0AAV3YQP8_9GAST|nr:monoacylglycerol lipase abhd12 [Plakobranchus ocellatus]